MPKRLKHVMEESLSDRLPIDVLPVSNRRCSSRHLTPSPSSVPTALMSTHDAESPVQIPRASLAPHSVSLIGFAETEDDEMCILLGLYAFTNDDLVPSPIDRLPIDVGR